MKKIIKHRSLITKFILAILIISLIFILVAVPIVRSTTFRTFSPYLVENLTARVGDSAAMTSVFLAITNPRMYGTLTDEFRSAVKDRAGGSIGGESFDDYMAEVTKPFESSLRDFAEFEVDFTSTSYPAVYIEDDGLYCDPGIKDIAENLMSSQWFKDYEKSDSGQLLYSPVVTLSGDPAENGYFCYIFSSRAVGSEDDVFYTMLFTKFADVLSLWKNVLDTGVEDFAFIDKEYKVLYQHSPSSQLDYEWIPENLTSNRQHHVVTFREGDTSLYSVLISSEYEGMRFVMRTDNRTLMSNLKETSYKINGIYLLFALLFIAAVALILASILRRLTALSDKMAVVQKGDYSVRLDDSSGDEIGQLASAFNLMTGKIQDNVNQLVEKEQKEKLLQYNLMVSAIDPHFINNTLNTSTRLAELGRTDDVVAVNDALINFLKNNLKMKSTQAFDTVEKELEALDDYIKIQNYLVDNTISLENDISDENMSLRIPKFLLQPIVENAILHGILMNIDEEGNNIPGKIRISVDRDSEHITIKVADNGVGMTKETLDKYFGDADNVFCGHIGVMNVRTRLAHLYNDNYRFTAESEPGAGTVVTIRIPAV